ncbi:short-chain oxidoreductase [Seiridium cupressi]
MARPTQTWLITGCSSGFGELFVRQLRASGDNVIAAGRHAQIRLTHLRESGASILEFDVSAPPSEIEAKMTEAWDLYPGGIDVVVNNAGYILSGAIEELTKWRTCLGNCHGPLNATRALLPKIRARGDGTLLYTSSQAGWHADPRAGGYCASKFALEAKELAIFAPGVKVLIVEPGYCRTRAFSNVNHLPPRVPNYAAFNEDVGKPEASITGNDPGNTDKAVNIMIDLVRGTGAAAGK